MTRLSISTVIKAALFVVIGVVAFSLMSNTLRSPVRGATSDYIVNFADVEGLVAGNPVKISGVRVGRVADIDLVPQEDGTARARVKVKIERSQPVPEHVHAAVRYGDMLGARYIALSDAGPDAPRRSGNEIPVTATTGPVNLTALMNGFAPLFSALDPKQVNDLAQGFVDTFAGRTKSVHLLLRQVSYDYERMQYNTVVSGAMKLLNALEGFKGNAPAVLREGFGILLRALYPACPHTTWVLWQELGYGKEIGELLDAPWPQVDEAALVQERIELMLQVNGKLRGAIQVPADADKAAIEAAALASPDFQKFSQGLAIKKVIVIAGRLVNVVVG